MVAVIYRYGQIRSRVWPRTWSWTAFLLGLFGIVLGLILVVEPLWRGPMIYVDASVWALTGGMNLIGDAARLRQKKATQGAELATTTNKSRVPYDDGQ